MQDTTQSVKRGDDLENPRLMITAADGFLGRSAISFFRERGYDVLGTCFSPANLNELDEWLRKQGTTGVTLKVADLSREEDLRGLVKFAKDTWGGIPRVLHAAGGFHWVKVTDAQVSQMEYLIKANAIAAWMVMKHVLPVMSELQFGRLVLVSAAASKLPAGLGMGPYVASKVAMNALMEAAREELVGVDVRIDAVYPTIIDTPNNRREMPSADFSKWTPPDVILAEIEGLLEQ